MSKRDLSQAQFEAALRRAGWKPCGFMGYWESPEGISVCSHMFYVGPRGGLADVPRRKVLAHMLRRGKKGGRR